MNDKLITTVPIGLKGIEAEFERYQQVNDQAGEDSERKAKDINEGIQLIAAEPAPGKQKVFSYHGINVSLFWQLPHNAGILKCMEKMMSG
jgi:hypothetical protein